jgi:predicted HTH domain antitoxin
MTVLSTRIPDDLDEDLRRYIEEENIEKSGAVRKLLISGLEDWKREKALKLLSEGKVSYSRAAQIAGMDIWEFSEIVKRRKIVWVSDEWLEEDME